MLKTLLNIFMTVYILSFDGASLIVCAKNEWKTRAIIPAMILGLIPFFNFVYCLLNVDFIFNGIKL